MVVSLSSTAKNTPLICMRLSGLLLGMLAGTPSPRGKRSLSSLITTATATVSAKKRSLEISTDTTTTTTTSDTGAKWNLEDAFRHLISADERFKHVIQEHGQKTFYAKEPTLVDGKGTGHDYFHELSKIIVFQQLSGAIAEKIFNRVLDALDCKPTAITHGTVPSSSSSSSVSSSSISEGMQGRSVLTPSIVLNAEIEIEMVQGKKKVMINGKESGLSESKSKCKRIINI